MTGSIIWTLVRVAPLASSSAAFVCSIGQQVAMQSFLSPAVPDQARRDLWYPYFASYKRIVYVSAPSHLTTIATCLINYFAGAQSSLWWLACIAFVVAHAHPLSTGIRLMGLTAREWDGKTLAEGKKWHQEFTDINGRRLVLVDLPGWLCVVATVVMNLRA